MMDVQPSLTDHRPQAHQHLVSTFTYDLGIAFSYHLAPNASNRIPRPKHPVCWTG